MKRIKDDILYILSVLMLCVVFCLVIFLLCATFERVLPKESLEALEVVNLPTVIIDPGHGGRDGGAIGNGIIEKDLNLTVSKKLNDVFLLCGVDTIMTRENDNLVCDENSPELKGKIKITDLKNRLQIANQCPQCVFVSIHMNNFSVEKYKGLQVYYSPNNEKSFIIAKSVQDDICNILQPDNNRKVKRAGSSIYLLDRINSPAILIECGFLSNSSEATNLSNLTYQSQLALIFANSIMSNLI